MSGQWETDDQVERILTQTLRARTERIHGRADSWENLRYEFASETAQPRRRSRRRRYRALLGAASLATIAALLFVAVSAIQSNSNSGRPDQVLPQGPSSVGSGYPANAYYVALDATTRRGVIVDAATNQAVRLLPSVKESDATVPTPILSMILSPDGKRVYGAWLYLKSPKSGAPANTLGPRTQFVGYIDLATNRLVSIAQPPGFLTAISLSADGSTIAYSALISRPGTAALVPRVYVQALSNGAERQFSVGSNEAVASMALSPDGTQLAFAAYAHQSVHLLSTTDGSTEPTQVQFGLGNCQEADYSGVIWSRSGLYAVRQCALTSLGLVRFAPAQPSNAGTLVASWPLQPFSTAFVREAANGPQLYVDDSDSAGYRLRRIDLDSHRESIIDGFLISTFTT